MEYDVWDDFTYIDADGHATHHTEPPPPEGMHGIRIVYKNTETEKYLHIEDATLVFADHNSTNNALEALPEKMQKAGKTLNGFAVCFPNAFFIFDETTENTYKKLQKLCTQ